MHFQLFSILGLLVDRLPKTSPHGFLTLCYFDSANVVSHLYTADQFYLNIAAKYV